jgi:pSer/pThr/pTyr-binding forkhead associated (FHA) protein
MSRSVTFGRGPGRDVVVSTTDEYMSPVHCRITEQDGRYFVADMGSTNGTYLVMPGSRSMFDHVKVRGVTPVPPGAKVRIGRTTLPWSAS